MLFIELYQFALDEPVQGFALIVAFILGWVVIFIALYKGVMFVAEVAYALFEAALMHYREMKR